jgi:hypothetical protein
MTAGPEESSRIKGVVVYIDGSLTNEVRLATGANLAEVSRADFNRAILEHSS